MTRLIWNKIKVTFNKSLVFYSCTNKIFLEHISTLSWLIHSTIKSAQSSILRNINAGNIKGSRSNNQRHGHQCYCPVVLLDERLGVLHELYWSIQVFVSGVRSWLTVPLNIWVPQDVFEIQLENYIHNENSNHIVLTICLMFFSQFII